jgi:Anti-sigma-K factor rskA
VTQRFPDFDDLVGEDVSREERERLRRAHELLIEAGPPPELSPELENVQWPDAALQPLFGRRKVRGRRPVLLAAALATAIFVGFLLGQATSSSTSIDARKTIELRGTALARGAFARLELGKAVSSGNWPMVMHVRGLPKLSKGGYYDLYLTKGGVPLVSCGTFNAKGETTVRLSAAYDLENFDANGWVIVRKTPANNFDSSQIVLRVAPGEV